MDTEFQGIRFEWDDEKAEANRLKHDGVSFFEAASVFLDPLSLIFDDNEHSEEERRFLTIGLSMQSRVVIVSYTERGDVVRIISARKAEPKEIRAYEDIE